MNLSKPQTMRIRSAIRAGVSSKIMKVQVRPTPPPPPIDASVEGPILLEG